MEQQLEFVIEFVLQLAVGLLLLLLGRRVFWILGGLVFAITVLVLIGVMLDPNALDVVARGDMQFEFAFDVPEDETPTQAQINLALTLVIGVLVAFLAGVLCTIRFPRATSAVVGFSIGAFFLLLIFQLFAFEMPEPVRRTSLIVIGTLVAIIAIRQPAETMIILSVMLGSKMIVDATRIDLNLPLSAFVWLIAMLIGIVYQTSVWRRQERIKAERQAAAIVPAPARA